MEAEKGPVRNPPTVVYVEPATDALWPNYQSQRASDIAAGKPAGPLIPQPPVVAITGLTDFTWPPYESQRLSDLAAGKPRGQLTVPGT